MVCSCVLYNASIIVAVGIVIIMIFIWYLQRHERFLTERFSGSANMRKFSASLSDPLYSALQKGSIRTTIYNQDGVPGMDSTTNEGILAEIRVI